MEVLVVLDLFQGWKSLGAVSKKSHQGGVTLCDFSMFTKFMRCCPMSKDNVYLIQALYI